MKKYVRRGIVFVLAIVMTLSFSVMKLQAAAPGDDDIHPTDVYIVLDNSYSMGSKADDGIGTDPNRLAIQCAQSFAISSSPALNSAIGLLTFSGDVEEIKELVSVPNSNAEIQSWDSIYTQTGVNTDIGEAVRVAGQKLISDGTNPNKAIILITDGVSKDGEDYEPVKYNGNPIPIYCIFINGGKSEDEDGARAFLGDIANRSGTDDIYEIKDANGISDVMEEIASEIYNLPETEGEVIKIPGSENAEDGKATPVTKTITIPDDVYEFGCKIKHDPAAVFTLKIEDPNGSALYDNKQTTSSYVTVVDNSASTDVKILWPRPGDYKFIMGSDKDQVVNLTTIMISATLNLSLDKTSATAGDVIIAAYSVKGTTQAQVKQASVRIHDQSGNVIEDSANGSKSITENPDGTFSIDTGALADGTYDVVAVADMDDGKQYASVRVPFSVAAANAAAPAGTTTGSTTQNNSNGQGDKKGGFPVVPVVAGVAGLLLLAVIAYFMSKRPKYVNPVASNLNVSIKEDGHSIKLIILQLPMDLVGGKTQNLHDVLEHVCKRRGEDANDIPEETKDYEICCIGQNKDSAENQVLEINRRKKASNNRTADTDTEEVYRPDEYVRISQNSSADLTVARGRLLQFRWATRDNKRRR